MLRANRPSGPTAGPVRFAPRPAPGAPRLVRRAPRPVRSGPRIVAALLLGLLGCRSSRPGEIVVPPLQAQLRSFCGDPLAGFEAGPLDAGLEPEDALALTFELWFLERDPGIVLPLLSSRTHLVVATVGDTPIRPVPGLGIWSMVGSGTEAVSFLRTVRDGTHGRFVGLGTFSGALPERATLTLELARPDLQTDPLRENRLALHVHRSASGLSVVLDTRIADASSLAHAELAGLSSANDENDPTQLDDRFHELLVLEDRPERDGAPFVYVVLSPRKNEGAFVLSIAATSAPTEPAALAEHAQALARFVPEPVDSLLPQPLRDEAWAGLERASGPAPERGSEPGPRAVLAIVARASDSLVCRDLVLNADDELLSDLLARLSRPQEPERDGSWRIEREAYTLLASRTLEPDAEPALDAVLAAHAGEVGRHPEQLVQLLDASRDRETFAAFLVSENRNYLQSPSPTSRARAFAWLKERQAEPEGFDPLATPEQRRATLRAYARTIDATEGRAGG